MSEPVNLPALGESVTEGTVTRWLKQVGDQVEVDEPIVEVSTDKVDTEIPSPVAGILEQILVQEDETVEVGSPLAMVGDGSGGGGSDAAPAAEAPAEPAQAEPAQAEAQAQPEAAPAAPPAEPAPVEQPSAPASPQPEAPAPAAAQPEAPAPSAPAPAPAAPAPAPSAPAPAAPAPAPAASAPTSPPVSATSAASADQTGSTYVTPIVRKLAADTGVDLGTVMGTGVGGRIRKQDVLAAANTSGAGAAEAAPVLETSPLRGTSVPMSRLRKVVAERAVVSMQSSAQLTTVVEVDVTAVAALRSRIKDEFEQKTGVKLSFLPFFTLAAAEALKAFPIINATIEGENIVYPPHENVSIAVDTERGLLTPVLRNASDLNIAQIAQQIADLADRTRENKLMPDELAGGTFTVTNTGSRGALFDTPVVFLPQSAILGTGIVTKRPVVLSGGGQDAIGVRSMVYLALSYDHRIIDGADAARFLGAVKARLEAAQFDSVLGI